jgi:hypothetical protein
LAKAVVRLVSDAAMLYPKNEALIKGQSQQQ